MSVNGKTIGNTPGLLKKSWNSNFSVEIWYKPFTITRLKQTRRGQGGEGGGQSPSSKWYGILTKRLRLPDSLHCLACGCIRSNLSGDRSLLETEFIIFEIYLNDEYIRYDINGGIISRRKELVGKILTEKLFQQRKDGEFTKFS